MCCSQSRVECRGLVTGLLGHCTFPKSSRPRFLRVKTDHGWAKCVGAQIELIRGRRWSWCVHPFIVLIIVFPYFMQNGHCQRALKSKDSCNIAHEMSFSLSKCYKVASFVMQATYPSVAGLFRSRSNVTPKDFTLPFHQGMSVNSSWGHVLSLSFRTQSSQDT